MSHFRINRTFSETTLIDKFNLYSPADIKEHVEKEVLDKLAAEMSAYIKSEVPVIISQGSPDIGGYISGAANIIVMSWEKRKELSQVLKEVSSETAKKIADLIDN